MPPDLLIIEAAATEGGKSKVKGVAYTGGKIRQFWLPHPVVVDLAGLSIPDTVPLLANHENRTGSRVGMVAARHDGRTVEIDGEIVSDSETATEIVAQAKAGADWQLSIGAEVEAIARVEDGTVTINGQEHTAPFYHVVKATLREVSVIAVGADREARMQIAASLTLNGGLNMPPEAAPSATPAPVAPTPPPAPATPPTPSAVQAIADERARIAAIRQACAGEFPEIEAAAIDKGLAIEEVNRQVLAAVRAARPQSSFAIIGGNTPADVGQVLAAALCLRAGMTGDELVKEYGEQTVEAAGRSRNISLPQLFAECAMLEGKTIPRSFDNDTIRAGFSTVSLPGILNSVANKRLMRSFEAQQLVAPRLCSAGDLSDFKETERYRLTDVGDLLPVAPDGELKSSGFSEEKATNQLDTYGKIVALTRQMIFNDDLGAFLKALEALAARGARKVDQLFFTRLLSNPNNLFSIAHKNYLSGTDTALSGDSLARAMQLFLDQVDADGQPINVSPKYLLVPTALKMTARELLNSTWLATAGGSTKASRQPTYNPFVGEDLEPVVSPYLSNANYTGNSSLAWYLFGDPAVVDTFEIGYLKGRRTPTVERGETDFDTLGIRFRVYFDLGIREQDHRGMVKVKGEN